MATSHLPSSKIGVLPGLLHAALLGAAFTALGCANTDTRPDPAEETTGYLTTSDNQVVRSGSDECVRTGSWEPSQATRECDPALVAQAAPPAQEPADTAGAPSDQTPAVEETPAVRTEAEPPPAQPVRVYVGADAFFAFNEAELQPQAKRALDRIAGRASAADAASIRIVGYADRLGSEDYNYSLSQRRAEAVHRYLLEQGVPPSAVSVEARGENDPTVACEGRQGEELIACLQPNRRTEIVLSLLQSPQEG